MEADSHARAEPSPWVMRFASLVPPGGEVLDLAAGSGRHSRLFLELGHPVVAVDRNLSALRGSALAGPADPAECPRPDTAGAPSARARLELVEADLEDGSPWPLGDRRFAGIVVTNYLWRPLLPRLLATLAPGGALLYETFAQGNERFGSPRNPDFLLRDGELLERVRGRLRVVAYEQVVVGPPRPAVVQRIAAVDPSHSPP